MTRARLIFFTDLDGTLLDHDSYDWSPAVPALEQLRQHGLPLILNSSKTAAEIRALREELGNAHPYIVENGAAVVVPADYFAPGPERVETPGCSRKEVLACLAGLRERQFRFTGFNDLDVSELASLTGLDHAAAARARERLGTEPVLWQDTPKRLEVFRRELSGHGLKLLEGGRFFHVMGNFDKADGMFRLMENYRSATHGAEAVAVALGDSPNDEAMLAGADLAVIIAGVNSERIRLSRDHTVIRSTRPGPSGWNECVMEILTRYGYC